MEIILKHLIPDESIDLIYHNPLFNSKTDHNILFKEDSGDQSTAQRLKLGISYDYAILCQKS